jgi:TolB-like protein
VGLLVRLGTPKLARPAICVARRMAAGLSTVRSTAVPVLPFRNMSGDPEQEYFADGITEDIINA